MLAEGTPGWLPEAVRPCDGNATLCAVLDTTSCLNIQGRGGLRNRAIQNFGRSSRRLR